MRGVMRCHLRGAEETGDLPMTDRLGRAGDESAPRGKRIGRLLRGVRARNEQLASERPRGCKEKVPSRGRTHRLIPGECARTPNDPKPSDPTQEDVRL